MIMITRKIQFISVDYRNGVKLFVRIKYTGIDDDGTTFTYFKTVVLPIIGIMNENAVKRLYRRVKHALWGE